MKFLDWQELQPRLSETIAASRLSTQAASFLGLQPQGLPEAAVVKAVIAELLDAVAKLGGGAQGAPGQPTITLAPLSLTVLAGQTVPCAATALDANSQPLANILVGLSTGDPTIAVIEDTTGTGVPSVTTDASGTASFLVSGVGAGTTELIAVSNGIVSGPATVVVGAGAISLALLPATISVPVGGTTPLTVHLTNAGAPAGGPLVGQVVSLTTSDPTIATVPASVTTDNAGAAQVLVAGLAAGSVTITASALGQNASSQAVVSAPVTGAKITIAYTDFITPYQSEAAAQATMAFIASKTNHNWKVMSGRTPSGGYPSNVVQIAYTLIAQTKCYDGEVNLRTQQASDFVQYCAAHNVLNPEVGYLHYTAGATMMPDAILSVDGSGNVTMKYDTETMAVVYGSAVGKQVTVAGNSNAALNGLWTVLDATVPAVQGGSAIIKLNTPAGATGTGGTMSRTASGNGTLPERYRTPNAPFTPSWLINPASPDRRAYEIDRLGRILATNYTGYGVFVDTFSNNAIPWGALTLEYNPANSTQYHTDMAALLSALRATMGVGPWRLQINTASYSDSGITQIITAAGSSHMESILTDKVPGQWPGSNQTFVAGLLADGLALEILNDVSVVDPETSMGGGVYANDPPPPSGNVSGMRYTIQSWINALMVWDGGTGGGVLAVNLWNDLWTTPTPNTGGIDHKWLGMLDYEFGVPTAAATQLVSGVTDPLGQSVSIKSRAYGSNLVVYRTTTTGTTNWSDAAAYIVTLPASGGTAGKWQRVRSDGTLDVAISTIALRPMEGVMLVPAGGSIALSPASANVAVGQTVPLTVTLLDISGSPVVGQVVSLTSSIPSNATVPTSTTTDSAGKATFNVTGVAAGSSNITATANGETSGATVITVTGASGAAAGDAFAADTLSLPSNAAVTSWPNQADDTRPATEATQTLAPIFKNGVLNSLPMVFYPETNNNQLLQYTSLAHTAFTAFFIIEHTGLSHSHAGVLWATPGWRVQILDGNPGSPFTIQFVSIRSGTNGVWKSATAFLPGSILALHYDSSSVSNAPVFKLNGTVLATTLVTAPVGSEVSSAGNAYLGNDPTLGTGFSFFGYLGEGTIWDGVLAAADENTEGLRLGTKWGIANSY